MNIYNELPDDLQKKIENILNKEELNDAIDKMYYNDFYFSSWSYGKIKDMIYEYYDYFIYTENDAMYDIIPPMMDDDNTKYYLSSFDTFKNDDICKYKITYYTILKNIFNNPDNEEIINIIKKVFGIDDTFINDTREYLLCIENKIKYMTLLDTKYNTEHINFDKTAKKIEVLIDEIFTYVYKRILGKLKDDFDEVSKIYERYANILHIYGNTYGDNTLFTIKKFMDLALGYDNIETYENNSYDDDFFEGYLRDLQKDNLKIDEIKYKEFIEEYQYTIEYGRPSKIFKLFKLGDVEKLDKIKIHNFSNDDYMNEIMQLYFCKITS